MIIGVDLEVDGALEQAATLRSLIARQLNAVELEHTNRRSCDLVLTHQQGAFCLTWSRNGQKLDLSLDYHQLTSGLTSLPAPKQSAFNSALGRKTRYLLDLSGGFGFDACRASLQAYRVTVCERIPLLAVLIEDAFRRLAYSGIFKPGLWHRPTVICENAAAFLARYETDHAQDFDCAYFDPMYPNKAERSAASNKYMQCLQQLVGADEDAAHVVEAALDSSIKRLVVKRPHYAQPLVRKPDQQFGSKLVHFDVYLRT